MGELIDFVQGVGFPIVMTFYLLHRVESRLQAIQDILLQLVKEPSQISR